MIVLFGDYFFIQRPKVLWLVHCSFYLFWNSFFSYNLIESVKIVRRKHTRRKEQIQMAYRRNTKALRGSQKSMFLCPYKEAQRLPPCLSELDRGLFCLLNSRKNLNKNKPIYDILEKWQPGDPETYNQIKYQNYTYKHEELVNLWLMVLKKWNE